MQVIEDARAYIVQIQKAPYQVYNAKHALVAEKQKSGNAYE